MHVQDQILRITVFLVEPACVAGALVEDVTDIEQRREDVVRKARQVIQNSLSTVQDIAKRLGSNAADSEIILNSIMETYGPVEVEETEPQKGIPTYRRAIIMTCCIDLDCFQQAKGSNAVSGDVFECRKLHEGQRVMGVLADGLGSGIEAASLASLTAAMAIQYVSGDIEARRSAEILMDALPVDPERHISYSTFSLADAWVDGRVHVLDHGNPPFILVRAGECLSLTGQHIQAERWNQRELGYWQFQAESGDRLLLVSDGITQAGMGTDTYPPGLGPGRNV